MATTVSNRLSGVVGTTVTDTSLADSAQVGTVTLNEVAAPGAAVYSSDYTILGMATIEITTSYGIANTPELGFSLPAAPWWMRFYTQLPSTWDAGHGTNEVRWIARLGDSYGLLARENNTGNIQLRLKQIAINSPTINPSSFSGVAPQIDQVFRIDLYYDGTNLQVQVFLFGETSPRIVYNFTNINLTGSTAGLSGYRFRDGVNLTQGDANADVQARQQQLLIWDPNSLPSGADGEYGPETVTAVANFQTAHGIPVDGTRINGETGAALDLAMQVIQGDPLPPPTYLSYLAVSDSGSPGLAVPPYSPAPAAVAVDTAASASKTLSATVQVPLEAVSVVQGATQRSGSAQTAVTATAAVTGLKTESSDAPASARASTSATGYKRTALVLEAPVTVTSFVEGADTSSATALGFMHAAATATGTAHRTGTAPGRVHAAGSVGWNRTSSGTGSHEVLAHTGAEGRRRARMSVETAMQASATASGFKTGMGSGSTGGRVGRSAQGHAVFMATANGQVYVLAGGQGSAAKQGAADTGVVVAATASGAKSGRGQAHAQLETSDTASGTSEIVIPDIPYIGLLYRFVVYEPDGGRLGQLPLPLSFQLGVPLNGVPSLAMEYSTHAPGAELLNQPCEVAVEFAPLGTNDYQEYPGCRFLRLRNQSDATDRAGVVRYTMPHYSWMLRKVRNIDLAHIDTEGRRTFKNATPADIVVTLLEEAQDRGNVPGIFRNFSYDADSAGQPWQHRITVQFDVGQDLWSILDALTKQGLCDWRFRWRRFELYNPDTALNRDRSYEVQLKRGRDLIEAPDDSSMEEVAARIFVKGDQGRYLTETNPVAITPWGVWEDMVNQGGVSDRGTMALLAQARMAQTGTPRTQMTRAIAFPTTDYLPFVHYLPGDVIFAPGPDGEDHHPLRVRQITIQSKSPHSVEGNLVLNDQFVERDLRMERQLTSLTGSSSTPGGSGSQPGTDTRQPMSPTGLNVSTETYLNEQGEPRGVIIAGWVAVSTATDGSDMDMDRYEVWVRRVLSGSTFRLYTTVGASDTVAYMSPFEVGEAYEVKVRAIARNDRASAFTEAQQVVPAPDSTAPPVPSDPQVSTRLGVINVYWDGRNEAGGGMPLDFSHVRVWMGAELGGTYEVIDGLYSQGSAVIPDQPYGEERHFYFTAIDRSGNESGPTPVFTIIPSQVVEADITPGSVGYELLQEGAVRDDILADDAVRNRHIAAGEITGGKIRAFSIYADRLAIGTTQNIYPDSNFEDADLTAVRAVSAFTVGSSGDWAVSFPATHASAAPYRRGALFTTQTSGATTPFYASLITGADDTGVAVTIPGRATEENAYSVGDASAIHTSLEAIGTGMGGGYVGFSIRWLYRTLEGLWYSYEPGGEPQWVDDGQTPTLEFQLRLADLPEEVTHVIPCWIADEFSVGLPAGAQVFLSTPRVVAAVGATLIEDGAITTDKIAANAITSGKIEAGAIDTEHLQANSIRTAQLAADAITAKHFLVGANIMTTLEPSRGIKMSSTGITAFDMDGNQTFSIQSATGNVEAAGTFQSGISDTKAVLISNAYGGRPGVLMDIADDGLFDVKPSIWGAPSGDSFGIGALVLMSAEITTNSSGRNILRLGYGSNGFFIGREYGVAERNGIQTSNVTMEFYGRFISGHSDSQLVRVGYRYVGGFSSGSYTYGTPGRTMYYVLISAFDTNAKAVSVVTQSASQFTWQCDSGLRGFTYYAFRGGTSD